MDKQQALTWAHQAMYDELLDFAQHYGVATAPTYAALQQNVLDWINNQPVGWMTLWTATPFGPQPQPQVVINQPAAQVAPPAPQGGNNVRRNAGAALAALIGAVALVFALLAWTKDDKVIETRRVSDPQLTAAVNALAGTVDKVSDKVDAQGKTLTGLAKTSASQSKSISALDSRLKALDDKVNGLATQPPAQPVGPVPPVAPVQPSNPPAAQVAPTGTNNLVRPVLHHFGDCAPEITTGCSLDVGVHADQIGLAFGVDVSWNGNGPGLDRCDLVVLKSDSWFENLHLVDARFEVYNLPAVDSTGWIRVLTEQRIAEQRDDYGCPAKNVVDVPIWNSSVQSPPPAIAGFPHGASNAPAAQPAPAQVVPSTSPSMMVPPASMPTTVSTTALPAPACATLDCRDADRAPTGIKGSLPFKAGDAVSGEVIRLSNGKSCSKCYFSKAPVNGTVTNGVIHPWNAEVKGLKAA